MIPKGKTTYWLITSFLLIAALSVSAFFLFRYFEKNKEIAEGQKFLLLRNNYLLKDMALNGERLKVSETKAKNEFKSSAILYRISLSVFINGGIIPELADEKLLPPADKQYQQGARQLTASAERISKLSDYIIETPYHIYRSVYIDTTVNGTQIETAKIKKEVNQRIFQSLNELYQIIEDTEKLNKNLAAMAEADRDNALLLQKIILIASAILILLSVIFIIYILNQKIFKELTQLHNELSVPQNAFKQDDRKDYSSFYLYPIFKQFEQFRQLLPNFRDFIKDLSKHNFSTEPSEAIQETPLHNDLISLRNDLQKREEEERERRERESKRQWAVEGRNTITNILQSTGTISELADKVIVGLVKYLNAAQGGIFLLRDKNEAEPYLEMVSAFAYDRKKYINKKIPVGDGLLGMAALEKTTYWLKKIPKEYIEIESGLGDAPPQSLFIVPLHAENEMPGVMEIASFKQFEKYEAEFIEDIAQSIGSSLRSVQIAEQTTKLLEESRKKSEELASQDAQMRKRFDELRDAQRLAKKNEMEMSALVDVIDRSLLKCELNLRGIIQGANRRFFVLTDYHSDEIKSKDFRMLLSNEDQAAFDENLQKVIQGETVPFSARLKTKFDNDAWVLLQIAPVRNDEDQISEILLIGNDISKQKETEEKNKQLLRDTLEKAEKLSQQDKEMQTNIDVLMKTQEELMKKEFELKALFDAVQTNYLTAEFDKTKKILWANQLFTERFNIDEENLKEIVIYNLISEKDKSQFDQLWNSALENKNFRKTLVFKGREGNPVWLLLTLSAVSDQKDELSKVVLIATDISQQKQAEEKISRQTRKLMEQEKFMEENLREIMEINENLQQKLDRSEANEKKEIQDQATESDIKYFNWIDEIFE